MIASMLVVFWIMQAAAYILFKFGGTAPNRQIPSFIAANVIGVTSTWLLMEMMKRTNSNVAVGMAAGGGFLIVQLAIYFVFRGTLSATQMMGLAAIVVGMLMLSMGGKP